MKGLTVPCVLVAMLSGALVCAQSVHMTAPQAVAPNSSLDKAGACTRQYDMVLTDGPFGIRVGGSFQLQAGGVALWAEVRSTYTSADGGQTSDDQHFRWMRDSEGRTRYESLSIPGFPNVHKEIHIVDPVRGVFIVLDVTTKTADVKPLPKWFLSDRKPLVSLPLPKMNLPHPNAAGTRPAPELPNHILGGDAESLGTTEIEGFEATGTKSTQTIQPISRCNETSILRVTECWYSNDLGMSLLCTKDEGELGQETTKAFNIHVGKLAPRLFEVPADYMVKDDQQQ
jgi:hypothetical protein